ncbi:MAG: PAS domain-containing protein, partial [Solirubrobacteraceae bacterium]
MPRKPAAAAVLEHLPAGVVVVDGEGRVAAGNPAAERLLGALPHDGARCC